MAKSNVIPINDKKATKASSKDKRRQRSERSRKKIVDAMFTLIQSGDMTPSAARVAETAEVSLRTVFRHFEEMDSLYREMTEAMQAEIMPILMKPYEAKDWRETLFEMVDRRADLYEKIFPVRVCANLRRFQSDFLMDEYRRGLMVERSVLKAILGDDRISDPTQFAAIELAVSFQSWRRLRQDQDLSADAAKAVMRLTVEKLVDGL